MTTQLASDLSAAALAPSGRRSLMGALIATMLLGSACSSDNAVAPAQPPEGFRSEFATVNGINLHYVTGGSGDGDPVVLIHGWPQTWYEWNRILPALGVEHTVIAPDLRGAGESEKPLNEEGYSKLVLAEDIHELVVSLGHERAIIVGHDIGAMVAYAYAATYPNEVSGLAILDGPLPGIQPFWGFLRANPEVWHFGLHADIETATMLVEGKEREYMTSFYQKLSMNPNAFTEEEVDEFVRAYSQPGAMRAGFDWYRGFALDEVDFPVLQETRLTMPVLALGGELYGSGDFMLNIAQAVADDVRGGIVAGSGHWLAEEQPEALAERLLAFFDEVAQAQ